MEATAFRLLSLLSAELGGGECCPSLLSDEEARRLYALAKHHDLAHLATVALERHGQLPDGEIGELYAKARLLAVYRHGRLSYATDAACAALEAAGIDHIPLKGAIIRALYPEPWMRTSCDVDILVHEEDVDRAARAIEAACGLAEKPRRRYHDVLLCLDADTHIELHFSLREGYRSMDAVLARAWEHAEPEVGHRYRLTPEFFLFYHVAHMAHHFLHGGCGLRPFLDLYLLTERWEYDGDRLDALLSEGGLSVFFHAVCEAVGVWLRGEEPSEMTERLAAYIFSAGTYGLLANRVAVGTAGKSRARYLLGRIFLPYATLCEYYPTLRRRRFLLPWYQMKRWWAVLRSRSRRQGAVAELRRGATVSSGQTKEIASLLSGLGLPRK